MKNIIPLLNCIFFGDFGLFTMTPRYLFTVLLPIMLFLSLLTAFLPKLEKVSVLLTSLGCTTAGLASLNTLEKHENSARSNNKTLKLCLTYIMILIIPCSAQWAIILTFAAMVSVRVFIMFVMFAIFFAVVFMIIIWLRFRVNSRASAAYGHREKATVATAASAEINAPSKNVKFIQLKLSIKNAFTFVIDAAPAFALGSVLVSLCTFFGIFDTISTFVEPFFSGFMGLPREAANIFVLNILKRDFGAASLLSFTDIFTADQMVEILLMLTFSVPCFNSMVILIKNEKLPKAILIWLGSLLISIFVGKFFRCIFSICFI